MADFRGLISALSLQQLREYASLINSELISRQLHPSPVSKGECTPDSKTVHDFVEFRDHFVDNTDRDLLLAECETLQFNRHTRSDAVQNRFLS